MLFKMLFVSNLEMLILLSVPVPIGGGRRWQWLERTRHDGSGHYHRTQLLSSTAGKEEEEEENNYF